MRLSVKRQDLSTEYFFAEGCFIIEISNSIDDPGVSIVRARVLPGVRTRWHRLRDTGERYCIINGSGLVEVGAQPPQQVAAGDVVIIPPMCRQRITNTGSIDLLFLAICTPRFVPGVYEDLEEC